MADDVLNDDDGVVDQDTDRENQREEANPVDGVAHHVGGKQGQQDGCRHHGENYHAFAPAQHEGNQQHDGNCRQA